MKLIQTKRWDTAKYLVAPASTGDISWIAGLEAAAYSPRDAIPEHVLREWHGANPAGFSVIRTRSGKRVGHIDILPLRPDALSALIEGTILEREIPGSSLFGPDEKDKIKDLYVESVIIRPPREASIVPAAIGLLGSFPSLIARIVDPSQVRTLYAIGASREGERLLKRLGFERRQAASGKAQRHPLFAASFPVLADRISAFRRRSYRETRAPSGAAAAGSRASRKAGPGREK
jgi:hypothetical protein